MVWLIGRKGRESINVLQLLVYHPLHLQVYLPCLSIVFTTVPITTFLKKISLFCLENKVFFLKFCSLICFINLQITFIESRNFEKEQHDFCLVKANNRRSIFSNGGSLLITPADPMNKQLFLRFYKRWKMYENIFSKLSDFYKFQY